MASTEQRIRKLEEQTIAIFIILDADKASNIEEAQQKAIDIAIAKTKLDIEEKKVKNKDKWMKLIWVPVILLIISAIVSWVFKLLPGGS